MRYLGMDVPAKSTVWCLLDAQGEVVSEGRTPTTAPALAALVRELGPAGEVLAGQEVGTLTYLVYDAVTAAGTPLLSFNAQQLRMIAASRKKTDRRAAYWIAKALQAGMYPHPVYVPTGEIRELRALLSQRRVLHADYNRWRYRARAYLRAGGYPAAPGATALRAALTPGNAATCGAPASLTNALALCQRQEGGAAGGARADGRRAAGAHANGGADQAADDGAGHRATDGRHDLRLPRRCAPSWKAR